MRTLYKFQDNFGRNGQLLGFFVADDMNILIGNELYSGESDICVVLSDQNLFPITSDQEFIDKVIAYGLVPVGNNPLDL